MNIVRRIEAILDGTTMYRSLLYSLVTILCAALFFGAIGVMPYSPYSIAISAALIIGTCYGLNYLFAKWYKAPTNGESAILTGLILTLVIAPVLSPKDVLFILVASGLAIASKYILAIRNKHIFNPVAIAVVLTAFGPQESANWWVGSVWLLPFVVLGGILVIRKIRRVRMALIFFVMAIASSLLFASLSGQNVMTTLTAVILHSSLFFLGFIMLTEPATSPTTRGKRYVYAAIVGVLFAPALHIGSLYSTPELALIVGNIFAFLVTPMVKTQVQLIGSQWFGSRTQDLQFAAATPFDYKPGQYIEMTLPHSHPDSRGVRRYFTLASSPTEEPLHLGIRYYNRSSSFKEVLQKPEDHMMAFGQVGGDFVLPHDTTQKLAFIAGGIGITPFRSMAKYLTDKGENRDVTLLYAERGEQDIAYADVLEAARQKVGLRTYYLLDGPAPQQPYFMQTRITNQAIAKLVPDYRERIFYISGPQPMVRDIKAMLRHMGVPLRHIKTDYFSGYA